MLYNVFGTEDQVAWEHVFTTDLKHILLLLIQNNGYWNVVYEFDADGCPARISYDVIYDVFNVEYDKVADTSQSFPFNSNTGERPGKDEGVGVV